MTKKFALMFALLLIPSFALAQDEAVEVATEATVAVAATEQDPPAPEPVAVEGQAISVGQGCVNCGQAQPVAVGCTSCGSAPVATGCGCSAPVATACDPCNTCAPKKRIFARRINSCSPCAAPVATTCGCEAPAPAPACGCSAPVATCDPCNTCAPKKRLFARRANKCNPCAAPVATTCGCEAPAPAPACGCSAPAPVSTGCGCGTASVVAPASTVVAAPVSYDVQTVSYVAPVASSCNTCNQTRTLRPFSGTLLRRR